MRRVSYNSVLEAAAVLAGFTVDNLTATPLSQFKSRINAKTRHFWEKAWHPELMRSEERHYRDAWSAQSYAADAEVWHADTGKYWTAPSGATSGDVPGIASAWEEVTDIDAYISLDQTGQTAIGEVRGIYLDDPETTERPRRLPYVLGTNGIQVLGANVPKSVFVWFRVRCPSFFGADYSADTAYGSGVTRYYASGSDGYDGDFWTTTSATSADESPETHAAKWTRVEFPYALRECVAHAVYADWLRLDGAGELALAEDSVADAKFGEEIIKLAAQGQIGRSRSA